MTNTKLKDLILKIANSHNKKAFSQIFDYFSPRIMGYFISSGTNKELSEDLTQEVLSTIWQKASTFNPKKANVSTWIFTIARNKRIDRIRKDLNSSYNPLDLIDALYQNNSAKKPELDEKIDELQSILSIDEKKLLKMNFFEGKTHKIISQDLEIPLGTVKSRIRNILIKIKNL